MIKKVDVSGGFTSANRWKFFHVKYSAKKISDLCKELEVPCYILVLPNIFDDEYKLYDVVKLYYKSNKTPQEFNGNEIVVGRFYDCKKQEQGDNIFDETSLCVAANAITCSAFVKLAFDITTDLSVKSAYIKDGYRQKLYYFEPDKLSENFDELYDDTTDWLDIEDAADELYPLVEKWAKTKKIIKYNDVMKEFECAEDVAITLCRQLYDNAITEWNGSVRTQVVCSMCGKQFDFWDYNENAHISHEFGFGSKYDLTYFKADFCCHCLDKVMDTILPMLKHPYLEGMDESDQGIYTKEDIKKIIAYDPKRTEHEESVEDGEEL